MGLIAEIHRTRFLVILMAFWIWRAELVFFPIDLFYHSPFQQIIEELSVEMVEKDDQTSLVGLCVEFFFRFKTSTCR